MTTPETSTAGKDEVWRPCFRAFFVYYVAIGLAVFGPLINPEMGLPPWVGLIIGLALAAAVAFLKFGQEYRVTPRGLKRVSFQPAMEEEIPWREVGEIKVRRGLTQSLLRVGNLIILDKTGEPRLAWERLADPKGVQEALEARRPQS
jgi:hypothetical protein